jgi:hypothetical protein
VYYTLYDEKSVDMHTILTTTTYIVEFLLMLGALASRLRRTCRAYLFPDSLAYRARLEREGEVMAERIAFYRALFHRPQKGA